jgi:hypothetical protein
VHIGIGTKYSVAMVIIILVSYPYPHYYLIGKGYEDVVLVAYGKNRRFNKHIFGKIAHNFVLLLFYNTIIALKQKLFK